MKTSFESERTMLHHDHAVYAVSASSRMRSCPTLANLHTSASIVWSADLSVLESQHSGTESAGIRQSWATEMCRYVHVIWQVLLLTPSTICWNLNCQLDFVVFPQTIFKLKTNNKLTGKFNNLVCFFLSNFVKKKSKEIVENLI